MNTTTNDTQPLFSRCSLGKGRWFWVTYASFDDLYDHKPHSSGYSESSDAAERDARTVILNDLGHGSPRNLSTNFARNAHRRMCAKSRSQHRSNMSDAATPEYVYSHYTSDYDGSWGSAPYRIIKKTAKRVYVERNRPYKWTDADGEYYDVETFVLDRQELEREGCAWSRRRRDFYYLRPYEEQHDFRVPLCFGVLGLTELCSRSEVESAYRRLALKYHPDRGGDAEQFKCIHRAYEEALGFCSA